MPKEKQKFVVALIGEEILLIEVGKALLERGHKISVVAARSDEIREWASGIAKVCEPNLKDSNNPLFTESFDLLLSVTNYQIIPADLIARAKIAAINFHDGPLPEYSGLNVTTWSIVNKETEHAVTWHFLDEHADVGAVYETERFGIDDDETAWSLNLKCFEAGLRSFGQLIETLESATVQPRPQDLSRRTVYHSWDRPFSGGVIDGMSTAEDIVYLAKALDFGHRNNPVCLPKILGDRASVAVGRVVACRRNSEAKPGTVLGATDHGVIIATVTNELELTDIKSLTGYPLSGEECLRALGLSVGDRLGSAREGDASERVWKQIASNESTIVTSLAHLESVALPELFPSNDPESAGENGPYECSVDSLRSVADVEHGLAIATAWLSFVCRMTGRATFDIAYTSSRLIESANVCPQLFDPVVPLRIKACGLTSPGGICDRLQGDLESLESRGPVCRDIGLRYADLRNDPVHAHAGSLPIGLCIVDSEDDLTDEIFASHYWLSIERSGVARMRTSGTEKSSNIPYLGQLFDAFLGNLPGYWSKPSIEIPLAARSTAGHFSPGSAGPTIDVSHGTSALDLIDFSRQAVAVRDSGGEATYAEIDRRSSQIADHLVSAGVNPGEIIGVLTDRTAEMLCALLAVWKAGCAYLPLDPSFPAERLEFMVADSGMQYLILCGDDKFEAGSDSITVIDSQTIDRNSEFTQTLPSITSSNSMAYVIYTSGSTGKPKGVIIPHGAVVNFLVAMSESPGLSASDNLVAVTTTSFDISALELFLPLVCGAQVTIADASQASDGAPLRDLLRSCNATAMQATPSTWRMLLDAGWEGQSDFKVLCGGEPFPPDLAAALIPLCGEVWNMYGPTETTVWSTCKRLEDPLGAISIGRPIANTQVFVLNEAGLEQPEGVPGELYIGGVGLSNGYLNRQDLTDERFVEVSGISNGRLYRTGDLAQWIRGGELEHLGRIDSQVKVRGFRIELGEIESVLASCNGIDRAVVSVWEPSPDDIRLVAYFVAVDDARVEKTELRKRLRRSLPDYMVPQFFAEIPAVPMTPNGKVDRRRLPPPVTESTATKPQPESDNERLVAAVWSSALRTENIGRFDNFFDLGGHSLLAVKVANDVERETGVRLELRRLVVENLAQVARALSEKSSEPASRVGWSRRLMNRLASSKTGS